MCDRKHKTAAVHACQPEQQHHLDTRCAHHVYYQKLCTVRVITQKRQKAHLKANSPRTILYDYVEGGEKPP